MTTILSMSLVEKNVMDVFARCTGFADSVPKRETERTIDMIWHEVLTTETFARRQETMAAIENLLSAGLLKIDHSFGYLSLTDEGYEFVKEEVAA